MPNYKKAGCSSPLWVSQNFLTSPAVIRRVIGLAGLTKRDHVVEIGAGKGHITRALLERCGGVTALEFDRRLYGGLEKRLGGRENFRLLCRDFLVWELPKTRYKVFANIPFSRTTDILRKLTNGPNPPEDAWLIVEKGAAKRFMGKPGETLSSLLLKPFFETEIRYYFRREDFHPAPSVDAVLLHLAKKSAPDIAAADRPAYARFLTACFRGPGLHELLTKRQISTALRCAGLCCDIPSREMLYVQWLCLFRCFLTHGQTLVKR